MDKANEGRIGDKMMGQKLEWSGGEVKVGRKVRKTRMKNRVR